MSLSVPPSMGPKMERFLLWSCQPYWGELAFSSLGLGVSTYKERAGLLVFSEVPSSSPFARNYVLASLGIRFLI